jgi:hypothetical protein
MIKRYKLVTDTFGTRLVEDEFGDVVSYKDHVKIVKEFEEEQQEYI